MEESGKLKQVILLFENETWEFRSEEANEYDKFYIGINTIAKLIQEIKPIYWKKMSHKKN